MGGSLPVLRIGSSGQHVRNLQFALNLWSKSVLPALNTDGIFGPKTHAKVLEYQRGNSLVADGIVGPLTWSALKPLLDQVLGLIGPPGTVPPDDDAVVGDRIKAEAERAFYFWGWPSGLVTPGVMTPSIAAAICADPGSPLRPRQGGGPLSLIFQGAGAASAYHQRCLTISAEAANKWQETSAAATAWRNSYDLPAWCGIFCYYVYFAAGINLGGWVRHKDNMFKYKKFRSFTNPKEAITGCIGVVDGIRAGGRNHHFIVISNDSNEIQSIDGNAWGPEAANDWSKGYRSVIKRSRYSYSSLKSQSAYFLFPDMSRI